MQKLLHLLRAATQDVREGPIGRERQVCARRIPYAFRSGIPREDAVPTHLVKRIVQW
jgi:hypothetical protein